MSGSHRITSSHLTRLAVVYIRQSSLAQVRENTESTARQYALADEAARLGWESSKILTIDADLGVSGRSGSVRSGFKDLVSRVCLGEVGAVFGLEVSRLARSSADLQRLLEFCSLTDTLIVDADGVYDLKIFNDRLLLGLKGTMSEAELHILAGRLQESKRAAAQRGDLRFPLPVGYVYDADGKTIMDPDEEVRACISDVFAGFEKAGSAYGVVAAFCGRRFPRRAYGGAWAGDLRWGRLGHSRVLGVLSNPTYAGVYVFGRYRSRRSVDPDGTIRTRTVQLGREEWPVVIQGHHSGYIDWERFLATEKRLADNYTRSGARPPREGEALLQGIVTCGSCGRAMSTSHSKRALYDCSHSRADHSQTPGCRSVVARIVDAAVGERVLAAVAPDRVALALAAADEVTERRTRSTRALELQVERARFEAARAERAFHQCEPENRLVARSLEQRWEEKLAAVVSAETTLRAAQATVAPLPPRAELETLALDLPRLWAAPTTSTKDRKRILRTMVSDITLFSERGPRVRVGIRWRTGAAEELTVLRGQPRETPPAAVELIRLLHERDDADIAKELNAAGLTTGFGRPFGAATVRWVRWSREIGAPLCPSIFAPGELSVRAVATRLGIGEGTIYQWVRDRKLHARRAEGGRLCVAFQADAEETCRELIARSKRIKVRT